MSPRDTAHSDQPPGREAGQGRWRMELQKQVEVDLYLQQLIRAEPEAGTELGAPKRGVPSSGGVLWLFQSRGNCYAVSN